MHARWCCCLYFSLLLDLMVVGLSGDEMLVAVMAVVGVVVM
jgi:hypothetical protein